MVLKVRRRAAACGVYGASRMQVKQLTPSGTFTRYGLSDEVGLMVVDKDASSRTRERVDAEVNKLLHESKLRVQRLLSAQRSALDGLAHALLEYVAPRPRSSSTGFRCIRCRADRSERPSISGMRRWMETR